MQLNPKNFGHRIEDLSDTGIKHEGHQDVDEKYPCSLPLTDKI